MTYNDGRIKKLVDVVHADELAIDHEIELEEPISIDFNVEDSTEEAYRKVQYAMIESCELPGIVEHHSDDHCVATMRKMHEATDNDFHIIANDGERVGFHKTVLRCGKSIMLQTWVDSELGCEQEQGNLDYSGKITRCVKEYIYMGGVTLKYLAVDEVIDLYMITQFLQISNVGERIELELMERLREGKVTYAEFGDMQIMVGLYDLKELTAMV